MSVFRIHKNKDYTVMSNYHLRDKQMSLKAKGLLSLMLSLPDNWDYSVKGLIEITSDGKTAVTTALQELERLKYLKREPIRKDNKIIDWEYQIYEISLDNALFTDFQDVGNQDVGNQPQYNTKELIEKKEIYKEKKENFKKPTVEEIKLYCEERQNGIEPNRFYNYYESVGWLIGKQRMRDWKACVRTWEQRAEIKKTQQYNKNITNYQDTQLFKTEEGTFKLR